ncbi:MAG: PQQ-like beta-propeller repeat protein, partial [Planctomycetaceae bacterium]|nr:PQQ-like beta-propeller repeat protein [Planctomycetaceae bacterium]
MRRLFACFLIAATCLLNPALNPEAVNAADVSSQAWPTFRGADRTAVAPDTGLLKSWPDDGPQLLWKTEGLGRGYSSVSMSAGRIYTMGDNLPGGEDQDEYLICLNQADGQQVWKTKLGPAWNSGKDDWQSSRSTPTIDGDRIYVLTAHGKLACVSTDGKELWSKHLKEDFGGDKADGWGYSESVLIDGDRVLFTTGKETNTMVALNKNTGDLIWSASRSDDRGAGHASVVISDIGGTRVYVQTTGSGAMGVRAEDGKLMWTYDIEKTTAVIPTPIIQNDLVFFAAGYKRGGALLKQSADGSDNVTLTEVYPLNIKLANKHGGIVLVDGHLYGDSDDKGTPFCADLLTGDIKWQGRGSGRNSASVAAADGHLYIRYSDGT